MRGTSESRTLFTSDLSTSEFLLVKEAGFDPVGLVVGSSIYHVGYQQSAWSKNQEMTVLTQAMYHARELAMDRMEEEAHQLGADGVVGVRLEVNHKEWGNHIAEFVAIGTAVVHRGDKNRFKNKRGRPFTSDLSGQDFYILLRSGYRPLGLVMGNCVYHVAVQSFGSFIRNFSQNAELTQYTQAMYDSRELAMERMQKEAEELGAKGIVGANIHERTHAWGAHVIEFFAIGTAVEETSGDHVIEAPTLVLPLIS
ncbi:MAG: heavy metal-binding domain-containing protein [Capsulimonas sp.]|uniref:heavy metal-binding domain-containing protein n=1 Tax=Capsulimonas sp. TaxID=2494211 RepID=UPI0032634380